jgi:hypothetical protein
MTGEGTPVFSDAVQYLAITAYFRGEKSIEELIPPFIYRPLPLFLASLLPFDAMTSINLVNLMAMIAALLTMYQLLSRLGFGHIPRIIGCGLFVVSFPTFYYSTIGYIDPPLIFLLTAGVFSVVSQNWFLLAIVLFLGAFTKETIIILMFPLAVYLIGRRKKLLHQGAIFLLMVFSYIIGYYLARNVIPGKSSYFWAFTLKILQSNLSRPRCYLSFMLSFGIPGTLSLLLFKFRESVWFRENIAITAALIAGFAASLAVFAYSMFSACSDGRFIWISYPFTVPMATMVIQELVPWIKNGRV